MPATAYDAIPYLSHSFPRSHPERLTAVAKLFGLDAPPLESCRVLELGCSTGGNLMAMAQNHPRAQFVGIDSSSRQIAEGWKRIDALGLKNIRLRHLDIRDLRDDFGEFDYIVSHGVFSWVPLSVQDAMLELCHRHLARSGVAYFSYNTYPGWHIRGIVRDMMLYRSGQFTDPATRLSQAKALVEFVAGAARSDNDPYRQLLKNEVAGFEHSDDYYLHHEHLEEDNHPIYFHDFARKLAVNGLQYLGESDVSSMVSSNFAPEVARTLHELGAHDLVQMEQYMDFVRCRYFRETLVCHSTVRLQRQLHPQVVKGLLLATQAAPEAPPPEPLDPAVEVFRTPAGTGIQCRSPLIKAGLRELLKHWPMPVSFADLYACCREKVPPNEGAEDARSQEEFLASELLGCIAAGVIEWYVTPPPYGLADAPYPTTIPNARREAAAGGAVLNLRGEPIELDAIHRQVLQRLDGQHDRERLTDALLRYVSDGGHELRRDGESTAITDPFEMRATLTVALEKVLENLERSAFVARPAATASASEAG
ncbi:MAG: tRNA (guanine-N(7)-)-methyltransferase [Candidatus Accumulibacter appositus]|uniref:tRNA (Guanine-N(7)-)-methyltransferase n=1 Tax=Candidatus Accumulibacter appositus TaxID=1454003 RepID=A0A011QKZ9_9PROT|nr:MAG: tRNA (guanine-N(7)-)-methyltransferase [Candidatus Accumulibacter appositus]